MSNPEGWPQNVQVYMASTMLNVSPGWRTRTGYFCEVELRTKYRTKGKPEKQGAGEEYGEHPMVFAAFPLAEAQVADLASSRRRQYDAMLQLSDKFALSNSTNSRYLLKMLKRMEQDVATKNMLPVVVPGSDGTQITYRFDPSLSALDNPASMSAKPSTVLNPISTPALIIFVCSRDHLKEYDSITVETTTRWVPLSKRHWFKTTLVDWWRYGRVVNERQDPTNLMDRLERLNAAEDCLEHAACFSRQLGLKHDAALHELQKRHLTLGSRIHSDAREPIPLPSFPPAILSWKWEERGKLQVTAEAIYRFPAIDGPAVLRSIYVNGFLLPPNEGSPVRSGTRPFGTGSFSVTVPAHLLSVLETSKSLKLRVETEGGSAETDIYPGDPARAGPAALQILSVTPSNLNVTKTPPSLRILFNKDVPAGTLLIDGSPISFSSAKASKTVDIPGSSLGEFLLKPGILNFTVVTDNERAEKAAAVTVAESFLEVRPKLLAATSRTKVVIDLGAEYGAPGNEHELPLVHIAGKECVEVQQTGRYVLATFPGLTAAEAGERRVAEEQAQLIPGEVVVLTRKKATGDSGTAGAGAKPAAQVRQGPDDPKDVKLPEGGETQAGAPARAGGPVPAPPPEPGLVLQAILTGKVELAYRPSKPAGDTLRAAMDTVIKAAPNATVELSRDAAGDKAAASESTPAPAPPQPK